MMTVDEALKYAQNALERAFEDWLESERPSGDCESVHRQWDESFANLELVDELQPVLALTCEVRRLRDDAASTSGKIIKMTIEHDWALGEAKRLREENERLRKDAAVSAAIERAAKDLPYGDMLEITIEKDSAMVVLYWGQGGFETMDVDDDNRLAAEINAAIDAARSAK